MTESPSPEEKGTAEKSARRARRQRRLRRRVSGALALSLALGTVGIGYATVAAAATPQVKSGAPAPEEGVDVRRGRELFEQSCITCHGQNLQGVQDRGPSLVGVGEAAVYFQVATGRMPLARQEAQGERKQPRYTEGEVLQLAAYVQSFGGGPEIPTGSLRGSDENLAEGGELFRLNCASCHNFAGKGAPLSAGKYAPTLQPSTDQVIWTAMLTGPQNMPVFSDTQITPEQKQAIVNYVQTLKAERDPGGASIGRLGPVPEGLVIWVVGIGALMLMILWIGAKT